MAKKQTKHTESRALKKEGEKKRSFFNMPMYVYIHPFSDRSLERVLDKLLKISPSDLPYNIEADWTLLDRWPKHLNFEEFWVLSSIIEGISRFTLYVSYDYYKILRSFHWKQFFDIECGEYTIYAPLIWVDPKQVQMDLAGVGMDVWNYGKFDFPDIDLTIGDVIRNAIAYWQSKIKTSGCANPKGKSEFVKFLATLIQGMIFQPKGIQASRKGGPVTYEYVFNNDEVIKFRTIFPRAVACLPGNWSNPFQIYHSINWSLSIVYLAKILQEEKGVKKVVLLTETRPGQKLQVTLRDFCEAQWITFISRYFPHETIDLDLDEYSIYLVEDKLLWKLCNYARFGNSPIIPLSGIEKSHQQRRH